MAIRAIVEGRNISEERVVELAKGLTDESGNSFEIIELTPMDMRQKSRFHISGYQNAFVMLAGGDSIPKIQYGPERQGNIEFNPNELGILIGKVARTKWNMETLAAEYYDRVWKIIDRKIDSEVKSMADQIKVEPVDAERRKLYAKARGETVMDKAIEQVLALSKKNEELNKESGVNKEDAKKLVSASRRAELETLQYAKLKAIAEKTGLVKENKFDRESLISAILDSDNMKETPDKELVVE